MADRHEGPRVRTADGPRSRPRVGPYAVIVAVCLTVALGGGTALAKQGQDGKEVVTATVAENKDLASKVLTECAKGGATAKQLNAAGLCPQAREIVDRPGPPGPEG